MMQREHPLVPTMQEVVTTSPAAVALRREDLAAAMRANASGGYFTRAGTIRHTHLEWEFRDFCRQLQHAQREAI